MATRRESTDLETGEDIESQFATGSAQTPAFSTALSNNLHIFGQHGADMFSTFPFASEQPLANTLGHQLQFINPNPGSPSSTISQSTIYTDLYPYGPPSVSTVLTDLQLDNTNVTYNNDSIVNFEGSSGSGNQDQDGEDMSLYPARKKSRGGPLDADNSINHRFPRQDQNTPQLQSSDGWKELKSKCPKYASYFLTCNQCNKKPHCLCARVDVCNQTCPNKAEVSKNTSKGPHISHCPICLRIGNGKNKGISSHNFSDLIDVYCCASCEAFYDFWMKAPEWKLKKDMKCNSKSDQKGCLNHWNLSEDGRQPRCTWCRMKLMQLLGFRMSEMLNGQLGVINERSEGTMQVLEPSGRDKRNIHSDTMPFSGPV